MDRPGPGWRATSDFTPGPRREPARDAEASRPVEVLSVADGIALVVGIVIGSAIFETPALIAGATGSAANLLLVWILGAVVSVAGGLCYAELASNHPDAGGDYHFLTRAFGRSVGFLFAWARILVIQTGSIALIAFVFGDYATQILALGPRSAAIWAGLLVTVLTLLHLVGVHLSRNGQKALAAAQVVGLALLIGAGLLMEPSSAPAPVGAPGGMSPGSFGLAMVFVLLTYGGWNEAAFVSAELRQGGRNMVRVMVLSIAIITAVYLLVNLAMLRVLGVGGMAGSDAVGAELMRRVAGERGAILVSLLVVASALASINAMIFTCARTSYALGRDFALFAPLGRWRARGSVPANALLFQGLVILALIILGALTREGFRTMVEYTAPVFWLFVFLTTISLIRLRRKDVAVQRAYSVPLYPWTPIFFAAICAYLFYSSVVYTGVGALVGLGVVAAGIPVLLFSRGKS